MTTSTTTTTITGEQRERTIGAALQRLRDAAAQRPAWGRSTSRAVATLGEGLRCRCLEHSTVTEADLPPAFGGEASAPTPTALVRAALANCLALGYRLRAAERGIELTSVRVTVESDSDVRGMLDPGAGVPAGFGALRYHVEIASPAPEAEIDHLVERADQLSPVLDMLTRPHAVGRTVSIRQDA